MVTRLLGIPRCASRLVNTDLWFVSHDRWYVAPPVAQSPLGFGSGRRTVAHLLDIPRRAPQRVGTDLWLAFHDRWRKPFMDMTAQQVLVSATHTLLVHPSEPQRAVFGAPDSGHEARTARTP